MSNNTGTAKIHRVEVWEQTDPRGVWKPVLRETTSSYTVLGAIKSVLEIETAKAQLKLSKSLEPSSNTA